MEGQELEQPMCADDDRRQALDLELALQALREIEALLEVFGADQLTPDGD